MALADWPPRRIVLLWIALLTIEGGVVLFAFARQPAPQSQSDVGLPFDTARGSRGPPLGSDSLAVLMYALLEATAATRHAPQDTGRQHLLTAILAESSIIRRDSLWTASGLPAKITPAQRESVKASVEAILGPVQQGIDLMASAALVGLLIVGGVLALPPLAAAAITVAWWLGRRRAATAA